MVNNIIVSLAVVWIAVASIGIYAQVKDIAISQRAISCYMLNQHAYHVPSAIDECIKDN